MGGRWVERRGEESTERNEGKKRIHRQAGERPGGAPVAKRPPAWPVDAHKWTPAGPASVAGVPPLAPAHGRRPRTLRPPPPPPPRPPPPPPPTAGGRAAARAP